MRKILRFDNVTPSFISHGAVGGREEEEGPLGKSFDFTDKTDLFGMKSFEEAEAEMGRISLNLALKKASLKPSELDVLLAGDLENQCVASSSGLYTFGIPYIGLYSACSTATEALLLLSMLINSGQIERGATVTTSHNSAAERQFRTPVEYGGQRTPTAQWTATAAGAFILGRGGKVKIKEAIIGKIVDGLTSDPTNMGAAMARAAADSIYTYFSITGYDPNSFDYIVSGDLGYVGSEILCELLDKENTSLSKRHVDCGTLIYDKNEKDVHAGASGCGCSASVLSSHFLPKLKSGEIKNILFMSTGALMSPGSVMQGENILGVAPIIRITSEDK